MILDKSSYFMGDIVKGCCYVDVKEFESNKMKLIVEGIEYVKITRSESISASTSSTRSTYTEKEIIFSQNLSNFIDNSKLSHSDHNRMEIPFEFNIPENILPSYDGKRARIWYEVKSTIDKKHAVDTNKSIIFNVSRKKDNTIPNNYTTTNTDKDNFAALKIEKTSYFPEEIMKGEIFIHKSISNLRRIELVLMGTEVSRAGGYTDYNKDELKENLDKYNNNLKQIPFEVKIPKDIIMSYKGKYSEFGWELNIRFDRSIRSDINISIPIIIK
jgi:hypothetical protein